MSFEYGVATGLRDFFDRCYRVQRLPGGSISTVKQYHIQFRHFGRWLGREPLLADLTDANLAAFLCAHSGERAAPTANKAYNCLVAIWRFAADLRIIDQRPTVRPLREPERLPVAWTLDELSRLLKSCDETPGMIAGIPAGNWWLAIHWAWWSTGERCSAMLAVETARADMARGEIVVPAEVRKGKTRDMAYKLLPQAVAAVEKIYSRDRRLLFPWPWCTGTFYLRYAKILRRAGLPDDRKSKPQRMRRSFASHLEAAGGNATKALGHSTRRVTERSYLDTRICGGQNPADLLPPIMPDKPKPPPLDPPSSAA